MAGVVTDHCRDCRRMSWACSTPVNGVVLFLVLFAVSSLNTRAHGELPSPELKTVYPAGGKVGSTVRVSLEGTNLEGPTGLRFSDARVTAEKSGGNQWQLSIPADLPVGLYDVRAVGKYGVSGVRAFFVGNRDEQLELEPNDTFERAMPISLDTTINGRLEKPGDIDVYSFAARAGQRIVLELWTERIDSPARGVLELYHPRGRRLQVSRGRDDREPTLDFVVPEDGKYQIKLFDQTFLGSGDHIYRLDVDTGPRVEFVVPAVVRPGSSSRITLFGRNLHPHGSAQPSESATLEPLDQLEVELSSPMNSSQLPFPLSSTQLVLEVFPYYHLGAHAPVPIGLTDVPIFRDGTGNHRPEEAQEVAVPCEVSGQLTGGNERDCFTVRAQQGEVLWIEALGARLGAPLDLDVVVLGPDNRELLRLSDQVENLGGTRFPTCHTDPAGRFVAPTDGMYCILVRNLIGDLKENPRRFYRLAIRREVPDFHLAVVSRRTDRVTGLNVWRGGREMAEIIAIRRRGMTGPIRITAETKGLPAGVDCPDIWLGPEQELAPLVVSASRSAPMLVGALNLIGRAEVGGVEIARPVRAGTMIRAGVPTGAGRLTADLSVAVGPDAPLTVTALPSETHVFQDGILEVAIEVERDSGVAGPIQMTGVGLPRGMENRFATIPAGGSKGWISFAVPSSLSPGPYTFAVQVDAEATVDSKKVSVTTFSNPITIQVAPARIQVTIDPRTPTKIARGQIIKVRYQAERKHGFIGKIHTELAAPGGVVGIRGRGVTFTGQTTTGEIQVIATEDATPGQLAFLRLDAVGTVEDQPIYRGSCFLNLEITE